MVHRARRARAWAEISLAGACLASVPLICAVAGSFSATGAMTTPRFLHMATLLDDGTVLVTGGFNNSGGFLATAEIYSDSGSGSFAAIANMTARRYGHAATPLGDGRVLITGGYTGNQYLASAEIYDPVNRTFVAAGSMSASRQFHTATALGNGQVLVAGGYGRAAGAPADAYLKSAEIYDSAAGTFTPVGDMIVPRSAHTATLLANGLVLIAGGCCGFSGGAELYDPVTETSTGVPGMTARYGHTATRLADGSVLIAGGYNAATGYLANAQIYDPASSTFAVAGSMTAARYVHAAALLTDGTVLVTGGLDASGQLASAEVYDPATRAFAAAAGMADRRYAHSATALSDGRVLVAGGAAAGGVFLASADVYDPASSTALTVGPASGTYGGSTTLQATLTSNGSPVGGKIVRFELNGADVGSATTGADGVATLNDVSLAGLNAGSYAGAVGASFTGDSSHLGSSGSADLTVSKAAVSITWNPVPVAYGTPLGAGQLNAVASFNGSPVPGAFIYTPAAGAVLSAGNQTLALTFTPDDANDFMSPVETQVLLLVNKANQVIGIGAVGNKAFGDPAFPVTSTASSGLPVTFAAAGVCTASGNTVTLTGAGTCTLTATQGGDANYNPASAQTVFDTDGIDAAIDTDPLNYSNDFSDGSWGGTTTGSITSRGVWIVKVTDVAPGGVEAVTAGTGTGGPANIMTCAAAGAERIDLDGVNETAIVECVTTSGVNTGSKVTAIDATSPPANAKVIVRDSSGKIQAKLATGQSVTVGSPVTAGPANSDPILVELLDEDGSVFGSFPLGAGGSVDVEFFADVSGDEHPLITVLNGTVTLTIGGRTLTLTPEDGEVLFDLKPPTLSVPADLVVTCSQLTSEGAGCAKAGDSAVAAWLASATASDTIDEMPEVRHNAPTLLPIGFTTVTFRAVDDARNEVQQTARVQVVYAFGGFVPPLLRDGSAVIRQSAAGRTIPVKFQLTCTNGAPAPAAVATIAVFKMLDVDTGTIDTTDLTAEAGSSNDDGNLFRYDATSQQYIYNLSTAGWNGRATYRIIATLDDGTKHMVDFSLR